MPDSRGVTAEEIQPLPEEFPTWSISLFDLRSRAASAAPTLLTKTGFAIYDPHDEVARAHPRTRRTRFTETRRRGGRWSRHTTATTEATTTPGAQRRILVVEDEATIADAVAARLRAEGFHVEVAPTGRRGVALCEACGRIWWCWT